MHRTQIVGRTITRVMRSQVETEIAEDIPWNVSGYLYYYDVFLELDGTDLVELGKYRDLFPLAISEEPNHLRDECVDVEFSSGKASCVGERIEEILVSHRVGFIYVYLSSGRYLWADDDSEGTELHLEPKEFFTCRGAGSAIRMRTYWGDTPTDHGGGSQYLDEPT